MSLCSCPITEIHQIMAALKYEGCSYFFFNSQVIMQLRDKPKNSLDKIISQNDMKKSTRHDRNQIRSVGL